jgi:hypothetical protein
MSEENIESSAESVLEPMANGGESPFRRVFADRQGETGPELPDPPDLNDQGAQPTAISGKLDEPSVSSVEDHDTKETRSKEDLDSASHENFDSASTAFPDIKETLLQPTPEKPILSVKLPLLEGSLPTPRDSSPVQTAMDQFVPEIVDHPTSPTERKEDELQQPTEVCYFPVVNNDDDHIENVAEGTCNVNVTDNRTRTAKCQRSGCSGVR